MPTATYSTRHIRLYDKKGEVFATAIAPPGVHVVKTGKRFFERRGEGSDFDEIKVADAAGVVVVQGRGA
ncbi:MAG: hypothetical protein DRJ50_14950 [Actinobacteria bacterium]|nr:MAG: hypothetical protein DRJ50_14950 [Actinomycetota bacterium]